MKTRNEQKQIQFRKQFQIWHQQDLTNAGNREQHCDINEYSSNKLNQKADSLPTMKAQLWSYQR